jgi:hypothetical protein
MDLVSKNHYIEKKADALARNRFFFYAACSKIISMYRVILSPARFAAACNASFCALRILSSTRAVRRSFLFITF